MSIQLSDHFTYGKLLRFTFPTVVMMMFTSVYEVVDGFFVSNYAGKIAFAAINFITPALMILGTVGFIFGAGGSALVAKTLGEGKPDKANSIFSLLVYTAFAVETVLAGVGFFIMRPVAEMLGAEGRLLDSSLLYARIILISMPFFALQVMFHNFFTTAAKPRMGFLVTVIAGVTNMVLDAVLVIGLPYEYKLAGAAVATVTAQLTGGLIPVFYFARKNDSNLRLGRAEFDTVALRRAFTNGISEFVSSISMSLVGMLYNLQLLRYAGENGMASFGVIMYVSWIFGSAFVGYSIGCESLVGYHFGAQNKPELRNLLSKSLALIAISGACMCAFAEIFAPLLAKVFVGYDSGLMDMTIHGFRIVAVSFVFMGFGMYVSGFFTGLNDGVTSAIISFVRTMVFECGAILLLPRLLGLEGVWASLVTGELMSVTLGFLFLAIKSKKFGYG
ncbi:MAG: polysaccharide biosynthesis C-terminal domain-containing protein [Abditibacteriota bacterium]|nr:polysaccharide biosynthesis C-terminal domain-containing protein [Abditibacteriota bacterium]